MSRNFSGKMQSAAGNLFVAIDGSVLKGSTFVAGGDAVIGVDGNFDGTVAVDALRFFVGGNVSQASRIVADRVTQLGADSGQNFGIGCRFDGILNVGVFDAASNNTTVTILGSGAGSSARFNVRRFETDTLVFNGNFLGNMRVGQDLIANLEFNGNVDRITIMGRVGSYVPGSTITTSPAVVTVAGRLKYLSTNSYFQATTPGQSGLFGNDATLTDPSSLAVTGSLVTGSYVTAVPTRQVVSGPTPPTSQQYSVPGVPTGDSAALNGTNDCINVTFAAPTSSGSLPGDGNLPVLFYEYTTNGGTNWRRFNTASQGPGSNIALTVDSLGNAFVAGPPGYSVGVRAVNAIGSTPTGFSDVEIPQP